MISNVNCTKKRNQTLPKGKKEMQMENMLHIHDDENITIYVGTCAALPKLYTKVQYNFNGPRLV